MQGPPFKSAIPLTAFAAVSLAALVAGIAPARADCAKLQADFAQAVAAKSLDDAQKIEKQANTDITCETADRTKIRGQRIDLTLSLLDDPAGPLKTDAQREQALVDAATPAVSWRAASRLGDFRFGQRRYGEAIAFYTEAVRRASDKDITTSGLTAVQTSQLLKRTAAANALAVDDGGGTKEVPKEFKMAIRAVGRGGVFSPIFKTRGAVIMPVPVPINFVVGKAVFTPGGEEMAAQLVQVLIEEKPEQITLIGHTDPSGTDDYNLWLSDQRVHAVAKYLGDHGVAVKITMVAKGKREPFDIGSLPSKPTQDEAWALDRRVEMIH